MKGGYETSLGPDLRDGSGISTVLVEHGYLSNNYDRSIIYSDSGLKALAKADCDAIVEFYSLQKKSQIKYYSPSEEAIFDSTYYADKYEDLRNAFGYDYNLLKNHYHTCGIKEGRSASPAFEPEFYLNSNQDLKNAFGMNFEQAYNHFVNIGIKEGRITSPAFDSIYYFEHNQDLQKAFGSGNYEEGFYHFTRIGITEGRIASPYFDVIYYLDNNSDLRNAFGNDYKKATIHYMLFGINENRISVYKEETIGLGDF